MLVASLLRASTHLSDEFILRMVRRLAGTNQFPMGQKFLEKALLSLKRAIRRANPRCRSKLINNLVVNQGIRGQAQRNWITEQIGYEIPSMLVISPTMRCPLRCYGCYAAEYSKDSDLDLATFDRILTEAEEMGNYLVVISGGEPFIYNDIHKLWEKHQKIYFQVYTSGVTLSTSKGAEQLAKLGNVLPCISVEGFEEETDRRRGTGHFRRLLSAFDHLRRAGVPFGFSATATRENNELVVSDEFVKFYLDQGAVLGWYFQYMPIGREPAMELVPTPEQRLRRLYRMIELREKYDVLMADFWNDGPLVGGCIAGSRRYLHINNAGDIEPCVFCQLSTDNVHEKTILDAVKTSKLLAAIRKRQPYTDNYLRPCLMIDNPDKLREVIEEADPRETCRGGARRLVNDLAPQINAYASQWKVLADHAWRDLYAEAYRETIVQAHQLTEDFVRQHGEPAEPQALPSAVSGTGSSNK